MNYKKKISIGIIFILVLLAGNSTIYAENFRETDMFMPTDEEDYYDTGIPKVTIDDVNSWTDRKGFETIKLLQRFAQPFSIIMFIACAIMALIGAFGNSHLISRGISGMAIVAIVYCIILYAPEILDGFLEFIRS